MKVLSYLLEEFNKTTWNNKANRWEICVLASMCLLAATNLFGLSNQPIYKTWSLIILLYTLGYTAIYFIYLSKSGYFEVIGGSNAFLIGISFLPLAIVSVLLANDFIPFTPSFSENLWLMSLLVFLFSGLFCFQNSLLAKSVTESIEKQNDLTKSEKLRALKNSIRTAIFTSDLPSTIVFFIMFIYTLFGHSLEKEIFFYGATTFLMLSSNIVWILNDEAVFEKI